jgi:hypothetical protein
MFVVDEINTLVVVDLEKIVPAVFAKFTFATFSFAKPLASAKKSPLEDVFTAFTGSLLKFVVPAFAAMNVPVVPLFTKVTGQFIFTTELALLEI